MKLPKANEYPKILRIKDEDYAIKLMRRRINKDGRVGECDDGDKILRLLASQGALELFGTIIHETLHAIDTEYKIELTHEQVYKLEEALTDLLLQNF